MFRKIRLLFLAFSSYAADNAPKIAFYCSGRDADARAFVDLAEARLSERADVRTLERANLDKVLTEQALAASGLTRPETAIKIGRLLGVDLFVVLDRVTKAKSPYGVVVYDAARGRRLIDDGLADGEPGAVADELVAKVLPAIDKWRNARDALAVCGMPIRNVDLPEDWRYLPETTGALLCRALVKDPNVTLLERSFLQYLNDEPGPKSGRLALSAVIVRLEFAKGVDKEALAVRGTLIKADGTKIADIALTVDKPAPDTILAALLPVIAEKSRIKDPSPLFDRRREAARFHHEARALTNQRETQAALIAAEAAFALADTEEIAATLAYCQLAEATRLLTPDAKKAPTAFLMPADLCPQTPADADRAFALATKAVQLRTRFLITSKQIDAMMAKKKFKDISWSFRSKWRNFNQTLTIFIRGSSVLTEKRARDQSNRDRFRQLTCFYARATPAPSLEIARENSPDHQFLFVFSLWSDDLNRVLSLFEVEDDHHERAKDVRALLEPFLDACDKNGTTLYVAYDRLLTTGQRDWAAPEYHIDRAVGPFFNELSNASDMRDDMSSVEFLKKCRNHSLGIIRLRAAGVDLRGALRKSEGNRLAKEKALTAFFDVWEKALDERGKLSKTHATLFPYYDMAMNILERSQNELEKLEFDMRREMIERALRRREMDSSSIFRCLNGMDDAVLKKELAKKLLDALDAPRMRIDAYSLSVNNLRASLQALAGDWRGVLASFPETALIAAWERRKVLLAPEDDVTSEVPP